MKYLHAMVRVLDLDKSMNFFVNQLGLVETKRLDFEEGRFSLIYLATAPGEPEVELTHNWDNTEEYENGRSFGHLAFQVDDIYEKCQILMNLGVTINRPPRDGYMAFIKSPDGISIELLQKGGKLAPKAPWDTMQNTGTW